MFSFADKIAPQDLGNGIIMKVLGGLDGLDVVHWNIEDKAVIKQHQHTQEQFGYVISGGFEVTVDGETAILKAGDSYFIPPNALHVFVAIGQTEAIDVFAPPRDINTILALAKGGEPAH